ncbi:MAG: glycosyltransferase family 4 protein [Bacteriovoracaceae bacterium]
MSKAQLPHSFHILIICPKKDWDLTSQWAYEICKNLLDLGYKITLVCRENSYLYKKLKKHPIHFIFQQGMISFKFWNWKQLDPVLDSISKDKIHLIHCFDLRYIWPLFFFLRKFPEIPLLHFQGSHVSEKYNKIWHKIIKRRVDHIFVPEKRNMDYLYLQFHIPLRKMTSVGLPLKHRFSEEKDFYHHLDWSLALKADELKANHTLIGLEVSGYAKMERVQKILKILTLLRDDGLFKRPFILFFASKRDWKEHPLYGPLSRLALETDFKHDIVFYPSQNLKGLIKEMDIWLTLDNKTYMNDSVICALENSISVMAPKSEFLLNLAQRWPQHIKGYQLGNGRELYFGIKNLLNKQLDISYLAKFDHFHASVFLNQYEKSLKRRSRLVRGQHLSKSSG